MKLSTRMARWKLVGIAVAAMAVGAPLALWVGSQQRTQAATTPAGMPSAPVPAEPSATPTASASAPPTVTATASASPTATPIVDEPEATTLPEQREALYRMMARELDVTPAQVEAVKAIVEASPVISQGNPEVSKHPVTRAECRKIRAKAGIDDPPIAAPCTRKNMAPLYDPGAGEEAKDAKVCIDRFEFPNIPCAYPVVYPSSREAALLCEAVGKRICDAHEWEGGCAGALHEVSVEYDFDKPRPYATWIHNKNREIRWAHGKKKDDARCGTLSHKSLTCPGGGWKQCGTNTYPAGAFPGCVSPLGVYDQHGNAAEHMNLPLAPEELASRGGTGQTEMKGSWFAFVAVLDPHEDDCRWRAKDWHPSKLMEIESHRNYHLGFRCCASVTAPKQP